YAHYIWWANGFYDYYQIHQGVEDYVPGESGPKEKEGELVPYGMHSPWGIIQQVIKETGWTWHYVLWRVSWANIMMMMADRPGMRRQTVKKVDKDSIKTHRQRFNNGRSSEA